MCPVFIIAGLILVFSPPKKINYLYGYRTKRSMKSQETWDYAQPIAGRQLVYFAMAYLCTSLIHVIAPDISDGLGAAISLSFLVIGVIVLYRKTERELQTKFGEE
ncbi:MAG: SdpI family protein [Cryomorphaceae bacterium]